MSDPAEGTAAEEAASEGERRRRWPKVLIGLGVVLAAIQAIPIDRTNPPVEAEPAWDAPRTRELFARACQDCHSNETRWPKYSYVAPASWLVASDVHEARALFDVSEKDPGAADHAARMVRKDAMPPWQYTLAHPEARLTEHERSALAAGLEATFGEKEPQADHE